MYLVVIPIVLVVVLAVLVSYAAVWVRRAVSQPGTLKPRVAPGTEPRGWLLSVDLAETHYAIFSGGEAPWGRGELDERRLVVFIHGLAAQLDQLTWGSDGGFARSLVDAGFCVLAIDLYGHGFSDAPDADLGPADFQRQLDAVLSRLAVTAPFDLIGFSHGCFVVSDFASSRPAMVKRLVLMSPFCCHFPCHSSGFVAGLVALVVHLTFDGNTSHLRTVYRIIQHFEGQRWPSMLHTVSGGGLSASNVQVLIVAGAWDCDPVMRILQHAHNIHQALPRSMLHIVQRGTHMTWACGTPAQQNFIRRRVTEFLSVDISASFSRTGDRVSLSGPRPEMQSPSGQVEAASVAGARAISKSAEGQEDTLQMEMLPQDDGQAHPR